MTLQERMDLERKRFAALEALFPHIVNIADAMEHDSPSLSLFPSGDSFIYCITRGISTAPIAQTEEEQRIQELFFPRLKELYPDAAIYDSGARVENDKPGVYVTVHFTVGTVAVYATIWRRVRVEELPPTCKLSTQVHSFSYTTLTCEKE